MANIAQTYDNLIEMRILLIKECHLSFCFNLHLGLKHAIYGLFQLPTTNLEQFDDSNRIVHLINCITNSQLVY